MSGREQEYVLDAFATNWVAPLGPHVNAFEQQIADWLGVRGAVSLSSGSAAIHLALETLHVKRGDVVLCQSFTFAASAFPIHYLGADPVFIDSEADTWNMDPVLLEEAICDQRNKGRNVSAIIVVHLYGMPAKMNEIMSVAKRYAIPVIEDAAEALGSTYEGRACGSMGEVGILSFNGNKIITTSGGGALVSNQDTLVARVRHLSAQAKEPAPYYLHNDIGYNYRLSNISAAIGRGQMEVLPERVSRRRAVFARYQEALGSLPGVHFLQEPSEAFHSNRWLTTVLLDEAVFGADMPEKIRVALETKDIESRPLWKPLHQQPVFENCPFYGQGLSDRLFATGLCLPSGSNMTDETLEEVIRLLQSLLVGQGVSVVD